MILNTNSYAIVPYKNKSFLKPILNMEDNLLTPLKLNDRILNEIKFNQLILSRFPNSNFVKYWLLNKLEKDKIIINAKINDSTNNLLTLVKQIENETIITGLMDGIEGYGPFFKYDYVIKERYFNVIKEDNIETKEIFDFLDTECLNNLIKDSKLSNLYSACYIIIFNNKYYYYIGSSSQFKDRIRRHKRLINNYIIKKDEIKLTEIFRHFLNSQKEENINFNIDILYLSTNYYNLFRSIYPDYKLSKGEFILLNKITDFIVKILEDNLIEKFNPKLNTSNKAIFKHFEWNDEFLYEYNEDLNNISYNKAIRYEIYVVPKASSLTNQIMNCLLNSLNISKNIAIFKKSEKEMLFSIKTLQELCSRYNLKPNEVLANLNIYHYYEGSMLKGPLKIIKNKK